MSVTDGVRLAAECMSILTAPLGTIGLLMMRRFLQKFDLLVAKVGRIETVVAEQGADIRNTREWVGRLDDRLDAQRVNGGGAR